MTPTAPLPAPEEKRSFDLCGPLPGAGVTVLEASAGTGKTFTIAALVTRFVAEGLAAVSEILAVTFTRMATGELRDRVRARLVSAEEGLSRFVDAGERPASGDALLSLLVTGPDEEVARRRDRLASAVTTFDEATITTTHGFCQLMLASLGVSGTVATGASLLEDPSALVEEVVDDLYVRWALLHGTPPSFSRREALRIGVEAVANPDTPLEPPETDPGAGLRRRLADGVRREVARRLLDGNLLTFDDLLVRLKETLGDPVRGPSACGRLRARYSVVLVDEFQDTDPVQWAVVRSAFGTTATRLVLIGDPKQAIYAFRGADVFAYLDAARVADERFTLGENWRSDADLLAAYDALFNPVRLGHPDIPYRRVEAAPRHRRAGLAGAPVAAPVRARVVYAKDHRLRTTKYGEVAKAPALDWIASDLSADVVRLLESGAELVDWEEDGSERSRRVLRPGDVAVLVGKNRQASKVQQALRDAGVPAVVAGTESVLTTPAAGDWLCLLEALEQPASRPRAVALALSSFLGMSADSVAAAGEAEWEAVHSRLHRWGELLRRSGVSSLFRAILASEGVPGRLLEEREGERRLTDLGHVAQLLHAEASKGQRGLSALRAWLARRMEEAEGSPREGAEAEERSRWLDSDAEAVQVLTIHRSKGLEFPVVYCPYLWDEWSPPKGDPVVFHDPSDGARKLDVAGADGGSEYDDHFLLQRREERGEALRQLYVALTRARHQAVVWWVRVRGCQHSSLGRLLLSRDTEGNVAAEGSHAPREDEIFERLEQVADAAPAGLVSVERAGGPAPEGAAWSGRSGRALGPLRLAGFERSLDLRWRRTSYSGLTSSVHAGTAVGSEPEEIGIEDEPLTTAAADASRGGGPGDDGDYERLSAIASPWADLPGGVEMGTFVHRVLERSDFAAPDLEAELQERVVEASERHFATLGEPAAVAARLAAAITTPLGPLAGGSALREVRQQDRLDEMGFELPVAGGDSPAPSGAVATADIGRLFTLHASPEGPLAGYGARLVDPLLGTDMRGYLTGSLDLVFRVGPEGGARYLVADYKSNWLGGEGEGLTAWHYRPAALDAEMQRMHYPLQAAFYMVALHRYLRWRLRGYSPEEHLGGVLYLFLRGMLGPDSPSAGGSPCGVFSWRPPARFVTDLSDLLEAGS